MTLYYIAIYILIGLHLLRCQKHASSVVSSNLDRCSHFSANATKSATQSAVACKIYFCFQQELHIGNCFDQTKCSGNQYIRLNNPAGQEMAFNDDSCGLCSSLVYKKLTKGCGNFTLLQGCYGDTSCSGQMEYFIVTNTPTISPTPSPSKRQDILTVQVSATAVDGPVNLHACNTSPSGLPNCNFRSAWNYCANISSWSSISAGLYTDCIISLPSTTMYINGNYGPLSDITVPYSSEYRIVINGVENGHI